MGKPLLPIVQFSHSVMSDSLWHAARLPCQSLTAGAYSNSCPSSQSCHSTISSSVIQFSFCLKSFPASGGQIIGASASVLPMNTQGWFPLGFCLTILQSKGFSSVFSSITIQKHQFFSFQFSLWSNTHLYMTTGKTIALTMQSFVDKVMSLLFNMLFKFVTDFFPKSTHLLISWLQSLSVVI